MNAFEHLADEEIIARCVNSESQKLILFKELLRRFENRIFVFCLKYLRNRELATEATQEIFFRVYREISKLREIEKFKSWLYRMASNKCTDIHRRLVKQYKIKSEITANDPRESSVEPYDNKMSFVKEAIALLDEPEKEVIMYHYFGGFSLRDLSEQYKVSEGAMKMRVLRARNKLKVILEKNIDL